MPFALAIQNLAWGLAGVLAGMAADRFGAMRVLMVGGVLYALGLAGMAWAATPLLFALTTGVLIGAAQAGTTYAVIFGVIGRQVDPARRPWRARACRARRDAAPQSRLAACSSAAR